MLEHVPEWLGRALRGFRAGADQLCIARAGIGSAVAWIDLASPAFADGGRMPERFTADGAGVSPPLRWGEPPPGTRSFALIVEDPDAPTPRPIVHAVVLDLPPDARGLAEGAIRPDGEGGDDGSDVGRNSYGREGWLPPDPPTGHGPHDYAFQLFALSRAPGTDAPTGEPGRTALLDLIAGHVLGAGLLTGRYSRGEPDRARGSAFGDPAPAG